MLKAEVWIGLGFALEDLGYLVRPKEEWPDHLKTMATQHWIAPNLVKGKTQNGSHVRFMDHRTGELVSVRRYLYSLLVREIPVDRTLRVMCEEKNCVNPFHALLGGIISPRSVKSIGKRGVSISDDDLDLAKYILDDVWPKTALKTYRQLASTATMMSGLPTSAEEIERIIKTVLPSLLPQIVKEQ